MNYFRIYIKQKIKQGQEDNFLSQIEPCIKLVKNSEPDTLQCEGFYQKETSQVIWILSYKNAQGYDTHISNTALDDIRPIMMPLVDTHIVRFYSEPTSSTKAALKEFGMPHEIVQATPGTIRLNEAAENEPSLQITGIAEVSDLNAYLTTNAELENGAAQQEGLLNHNVYSRGGNKLAFLEGYKNQEKMLEWATSETAEKCFPILGPLFTSMKFEILGEINGAAKEFMDGWGATYYDKIAGFSRF